MGSPVQLIELFLSQRREHVTSIRVGVAFVGLVAVVAERIQIHQIKLCRRHGAMPEVAALKYAPVTFSAKHAIRPAQPSDLRYQGFQIKLDLSLAIPPRLAGS